jgi:hypothetical protein
MPDLILGAHRQTDGLRSSPTPQLATAVQLPVSMAHGGAPLQEFTRPRFPVTNFRARARTRGELYGEHKGVKHTADCGTGCHGHGSRRSRGETPSPARNSTTTSERS